MCVGDQAGFDVIVVGGGNAGLVAAISARELGARVHLIEASDARERGGNSRYASAIFRTVHGGAADLRELLADPEAVQWDRLTIPGYSSERYIEDVIGGDQYQSINRDLVGAFVTHSHETAVWFRDHGVKWSLNAPVPSEDERLVLDRGGELIVDGRGVALVEALYRQAEAAGIEIRYGERVADLVFDDEGVTGVRLAGTDEVVVGRAVILACGGFEASAELRERYLGGGWANAKVRGTRFNDGGLLERAIGSGVGRAGDWSAVHAVPIDVSAPAIGNMDVGDASARYSFSLGITVNRDGDRFFDEGADEMPFVYSAFGRRIMEQPGGVAFQLFDSTTVRFLEERYATSEPLVAASVRELAALMGVEPERLSVTVERFNAACADGEVRRGAKDGMASHPPGQPAKSNWAQPIIAPPFSAYPVTAGVTFTVGGLASDTNGRVLREDGTPIPGLLAAGEITGGFFTGTVPAGAGLMRGAVWGRLSAATAVHDIGG